MLSALLEISEVHKINKTPSILKPVHSTSVDARQIPNEKSGLHNSISACGAESCQTVYYDLDNITVMIVFMCLLVSSQKTSILTVPVMVFVDKNDT